MLSRQIRIVIQFRGGCSSCRVTPWAHGDVISQWWPCTGPHRRMSNSCRGRSQEEKARLRATASRVGDAPTGRALKRVRFAADPSRRRCRDARGHVRRQPPSSLLAEAATTNSLSAHSSAPALPASAVEVPDQVMSEGASSTPDAGGQAEQEAL